MSQPEQSTLPKINFDMAIGNVIRILQHAEMEPNLQLMERLEKLADSWYAVAALLHQREQS